MTYLRRVVSVAFALLLVTQGVFAEQQFATSLPPCVVPPTGGGGSPYVSVYVQGQDEQPLPGDIALQLNLYRMEQGEAVWINSICNTGATCFQNGRTFITTDYLGNPITVGKYHIRAYGWDMYRGEYATEVYSATFMVDGPTNVTATLPNLKYRLAVTEATSKGLNLSYNVAVSQAVKRDDVDIFTVVSGETSTWGYSSREENRQKMVMPANSNNGEFPFTLSLASIPTGFWVNITVYVANSANHNEIYAETRFSVLVREPEMMTNGLPVVLTKGIK